MSGAQRRTSWAVGLIVAAASLAVVSGLYWWRLRSADRERQVLRGVRDILAEFRTRMEDLQSKIDEGVSPA